MSAADLAVLEHELGYSFSNPSLLRRALSHSSAAPEENYERLEFLGDRVLGLVIAQSLYMRFPYEAEGDLAKRLAALVQGELLAEIALDLGLGPYIDLSSAERSAGGAKNQNILADVFESVIGAMYLDGGFEICRALIEKCWAGRFDAMVLPPQHPKTALQEWAQGKGLTLPVYSIASQHGPDHAPVFEIRLSVQGYPDVLACGRSRQAAEKDAAEKFLQNLSSKNA